MSVSVSMCVNDVHELELYKRIRQPKSMCGIKGAWYFDRDHICITRDLFIVQYNNSLNCVPTSTKNMTCAKQGKKHCQLIFSDGIFNNSNSLDKHVDVYFGEKVIESIVPKI